MSISRRNFIKGSSSALIAGMLPVSMVKLAFAKPEHNFTFAYISDSHIQHIKNNQFVRNWDQGLKRAVAEANLLDPKPDFAVFGGDLAQLGTKAELDHGAEILSGLRYKNYMVMGEHDYYLDYGEYWSELYGKQYYSFDHKGVHFVVLNSILTYDEWNNRWDTAEQRMGEMAGLDNPNGSPFMVGKKQLKWLKKDLAKYDKDTPVVVFSHSPLQKIYKGWNFWTEEAEQIQKLLNRFEQANVIYGHVHQIQYNQIGNIAFSSVMSTAWPWPYPSTYAQAESHLPILTVPMNRADPFDERDATGWQFMNMHSGRTDLSFNLYSNDNRILKWNAKRNHLEDDKYQYQNNPTAPQKHY
ncbi:metallophosphoesterase family protein [Aliikangiella coralliicola]|uniref:Serine/threonine protein phosphatase n=1 Tax=Aliikangiella coralliicola TaxID=2592383 RepID=A0A545UDI3_9GAMM|nr:metallophosphoesterase [Aliikangiella coralliicola]TQV87534.1 serine/threonine protein phosphatase [Aliikangiella coralliicola]